MKPSIFVVFGFVCFGQKMFITYIIKINLNILKEYYIMLI